MLLFSDFKQKLLAGYVFPKPTPAPSGPSGTRDIPGPDFYDGKYID